MSMTSRFVRRGLFALPLIAVVTLASSDDAARADGTADRVVARVGTQTITVGDVERRLATVPGFQRSSYGSTPDEIKRNFVERVLVPELLYAQGALERGIGNHEDVKLRERDLLRSVLVQRIRDQAVSPQDVSKEDVLRYYEENRDRYASPSRYAVWRILVATQDEARKVLEQARKDPTPRTWTELARDRSLDKSTNLRGGNLGFVTDSGTSADGKTRVDLAIVEAAKQVKDGEFVDHPVPEGSGFAVIWRRGSMPAVNRTVQDEELTIRRLVARARSVEAQEKLIAELRSRDAKVINPNGIDLIDVSSAGEVAVKSKPGRVERHPGRTAPRETERGLR